MRKVFFRYIFFQFWPPFFFGLGVFSALIFFGMLFDKLNTFINMNPKLSLFVAYLFCLPYYTNQVFPMASLLATLFALGKFLKSGEWKAGLAGGYRPLFIISPFILCSIIVSIFHLGWQELVSPPLYKKSQGIYNYKIKENATWNRFEKKNISFSVPGYIVSALRFDGNKNEMQKIIADKYSKDRLIRQIVAEKGRWDSGKRKWIFFNGTVIDYSGKMPRIKRFSSYESEVKIPLKNIIFAELKYDEVNISSLRERIQTLKKVGSKTHREQTFLYLKASFPLSNIIMTLIGIAITFLIGKTNRMLDMGIAIVCGFVFWAFAVISGAAGKVELFTPFWAGFSPVFLFFAASLLGLRKAKIL